MLGERHIVHYVPSLTPYLKDKYATYKVFFAQKT